MRTPAYRLMPDGWRLMPYGQSDLPNDESLLA